MLQRTAGRLHPLDRRVIGSPARDGRATIAVTGAEAGFPRPVDRARP